MTRLLRPKIILPLLLSASLLAALLAFADVKKVVALMSAFDKLYLLYFLLLMAAYTAVRGAQWHELLAALEIDAPLRSQMFAFLVGEVTKSIPIGNYVQNYILQQARGTDFGRSSAATTLIVLIEVAVALSGVVILGLGDWTGWLRPLIVGGAAATLLLVWAYRRFGRHAARTPRWLREHATVRQALAEVRQFRAGAAALFHPRILAVALLLGAVYVTIAGAALYLIVRGLGIGGVSFWQVLAVSYFSLGFSLIVPILLDIGVVEISAVGAFLAVGVSKTDAVGAVLINRALSIGTALVSALIGTAILRDEVRAALQGRGRAPGTAADARGGEAPTG